MQYPQYPKSTQVDIQYRERFIQNGARGSDAEPLLYQGLYDEIVDASLPGTIALGRDWLLGGVTLAGIGESGAVYYERPSEEGLKMQTIEMALRQQQADELDERRAKDAVRIYWNAWLNHLHFAPFLLWKYPANRYTSANTWAFENEEKALDKEAQQAERMVRTIEDAIIASLQETVEVRRSPFVLLASVGDLFRMERMVKYVQLLEARGLPFSSALSHIQHILIYGGWEGMNPITGYVQTFPGVEKGEAYLISVNRLCQMDHARSFVKNPLQMVSTDVKDPMAFQARLTLYVEPQAITQKLSWPQG